MFSGETVDLCSLCFQSPALIVCLGGARSGKSTTISQLLCSKKAFPKYSRIGLVAPHPEQAPIQALENFCHENHIALLISDSYDETFIRTFCSTAKNEPFEKSLLIADDVFAQLDSDKSCLTDLCSHLASHACDVLITAQSLSFKSVAFRQCVQNASYILIFPSIQMNASMRYLSNALFPGYKSLLPEVIHRYSFPFSFFIIDCTQQCPSHLRLRQHCPGSDKPIYVFNIEDKHE